MITSPLLRTRRFLPLFLTQFLGALNDNFFKTAVVILVTYRTSEEWHVAPQTLVTVAGSLFIFPYIIFCATAGKLADRFDKAMLARVIKWAEILCMVLAAAGFIFHLIGLLFLVVFLMGAHSAFFSPVKYALLPDQLMQNELMEGNAYIESGTFIAILLGTIAGGVLVLRPHGEMLVSTLVITIAILGLIASRFILPATTEDSKVKVHWNILLETWEILSYVARRKALFKSVLANSWFWFVAITFITQFPAYTKQIIGADGDVVTLFLTSFSIGIGIGAIACGTLLRGKVSTRFVPWAALAMSLFIFDLCWISPHTTEHMQGALISVTTFLAQPRSWRMVFDLFMFAGAGGFYIVPLYAVIQQQSEAKHRAQVMAANNVVNAFFMVATSSMALVLFAYGMSVAGVFLLVGIMNAAVGILLFTAPGKLAAGS